MIVASGSCSCCCCCCLHSLGGLIGASLGAKNAPGVHTGLADRLYWLVLSTLVLLSFVYAFETTEEYVGMALILALALPLLQLAASAIAAGLVLVSPAQQKRACLKRIGVISLKSFGFAAVGMLAMVAVGVLLSSI